MYTMNMSFTNCENITTYATNEYALRWLPRVLALLQAFYFYRKMFIIFRLLGQGTISTL